MDAPPTPIWLSKRDLAVAMVLALSLAGAALVGVILPSSYGLDPVGLGSVLGTTRAPAGDDGGPSAIGAFDRQEAFNITLAPGRALGYAFAVDAGEAVRVLWNATAEVNATLIAGEGQDEEILDWRTAASYEATLSPPAHAPFRFVWSNPGSETVTIRLSFDGTYVPRGVFRP